MMPTPPDPKFDTLVSAVRRFESLVANAQPGHFTWFEAVQSVWDEVLAAAGAIGLNDRLLSRLLRRDANLNTDGSDIWYVTMDAGPTGDYVDYQDVATALGSTRSSTG